MTKVHVYRAKDQPATKHYYDLQIGDRVERFWTTLPDQACCFTRCCKRKRHAKNLVVHVYYDGMWFYCRPGTGCKK